MPPDVRADLERAARELLATAVGFAVLGLNKVQVERRRLEASMRRRADDRRDDD